MIKVNVASVKYSIKQLIWTFSQKGPNNDNVLSALVEGSKKVAMFCCLCTNTGGGYTFPVVWISSNNDQRAISAPTCNLSKYSVADIKWNWSSSAHQN